MPRPFERLMALFCYLGALRVPVVAFVIPDWVFTLPSGLLVAGAVWLYSRRRSPFLAHHAREGLVWALQTNLLLLAVAVAAKLLYLSWFHTGLPVVNELWHITATIFRWTGVLVSLLTLFVMTKAAKGQTGDPLSLPR